MCDRNPADERQIATARHWFGNETANKTFMDHTTDLVSMTSRHVPLLRRIDETLQSTIQPMMQRFTLQSFTSNPSRPSVPTLSPAKRNARLLVVETWLYVLLILTMFLGPIWALSLGADRRHKIGVISICVGLFSMFMSMATIGQPFQTVTATATYAAVLMVFLQIED